MVKNYTLYQTWYSLCDIEQAGSTNIRRLLVELEDDGDVDYIEDIVDINEFTPVRNNKNANNNEELQYVALADATGEDAEMAPDTRRGYRRREGAGDDDPPNEIEGQPLP
ncbi:hypothetical protein BGZ58_001408 [Dissophora ornata]|nr:hypothetical protein BGZ58_001408 [Dissophora ornata]